MMSWEEGVCPAWCRHNRKEAGPGHLSFLVNDFFLFQVKMAVIDAGQATAAPAVGQDV